MNAKVGKPIKLTFFDRRPGQGNFSVERVFDSVRANIPGWIEQKIFTPMYISRGILTRIYDILEAPFHQGDVNHITGDVHFLSYLLKKEKTILTILDCVFLQSDLSKFGKAIVKFFWYTIPAKRVRFITTISEFSKAQILSVVKFDENKIFVIPVPLVAGFKFSKTKFNQSEPHILQIGTAPNKNLFRLFDALEGVNCHLTIVGELNRDHLVALKKHKIKFSNLVNISDKEIVDQYKKCDLVSFVSTYEGFGMPIVEANAIGRPVITSNIAPMSNVAGLAACLVDPSDVYSIRAGILKIINNKLYRDKLVKLGVENAKRFDPKKIAGEYLKLYKKIANY